MRKWFIILMTAVGMTLFMLLGYSDLTSQETPLPNGGATFPESGLLHEAAAPQVDMEAVVAVDADTFAALKQATERFELQRPHVEVKLRNVTKDELQHQYRLQTQTGEAPDVMLYPAAWIRHEAAEGRLMALDDYITAEQQSQWFEAVRGAVRWNGYIWGVPADWNPYVFVTTANSLIKENELPVTVTDWLTLGGGALPLSEPKGYAEALLRDWASPSSEEGPTFVEAAEARGKAVVDEPVQEASQALVEAPVQGEAVATGVEPNGVLERQMEGTMEAVKNGDAAWALVTLSEAVRQGVGNDDPALSMAAFVPDERPTEGEIPPFAGSSYVITPSALHPLEAADWIRFVTDPALLEQYELLEDGRWPVYRSLYGLPSSMAGGGPSLLVSAGGAPEMVSLPNLFGQEGRKAWGTLRPIMRSIDRVAPLYGSPPDELPSWTVP